MQQNLSSEHLTLSDVQTHRGDAINTNIGQPMNAPTMGRRHYDLAALVLDATRLTALSSIANRITNNLTFTVYFKDGYSRKFSVVEEICGLSNTADQSIIGLEISGSQRPGEHYLRLHIGRFDLPDHMTFSYDVTAPEDDLRLFVNDLMSWRRRVTPWYSPIANLRPYQMFTWMTWYFGLVTVASLSTALLGIVWLEPWFKLGTFAAWLPIGALLVGILFAACEMYIAPFWFPKTVFEIGDGVGRNVLLTKYREWVGIGFGLALVTGVLGSVVFSVFT